MAAQLPVCSSALVVNDSSTKSVCCVRCVRVLMLCMFVSVVVVLPS